MIFGFKKIREYENLHILLWLLKDTCWVMDWKVSGLIMIVPTLAAAFHITWLRRDLRADLFHNLAVCLWISGNSIWMIGEFFFDDNLRPVTTAFFIVGVLIVAWYYFSIFRDKRSDPHDD